jgi:hypothetical protein
MVRRFAPPVNATVRRQCRRARQKNPPGLTITSGHRLGNFAARCRDPSRNSVTQICSSAGTCRFEPPRRNRQAHPKHVRFDAGIKALSMRRPATTLPGDLMRRIRHFGDFVTIPMAAVIFIGLAGLDRLYLVVLGFAAWTFLEYLVHRIVFHLHSVGRRLHQLHHDNPSDPDAERSSLSTPLLGLPVGYLLIVGAGLEDGSAIFAGLLLGYLAFIVIHHAVHRRPIEPSSLLYSAKMRHLIHHHVETCNFGVTTDFWDIVFRTNARAIGDGVRSEAG